MSADSLTRARIRVLDIDTGDGHQVITPELVSAVQN
jgi:hypothetical protein